MIEDEDGEDAQAKLLRFNTRAESPILELSPEVRNLLKHYIAGNVPAWLLRPCEEAGSVNVVPPDPYAEGIRRLREEDQRREAMRNRRARGEPL